MKSYIYSSAFMAALVAAAPQLKKRAGTDIDETILNYALTLEHLEATFYAQGLKTFKAADFTKAGFDDTNFYAKLKKIGADEAAHVTVIETVMKAAGYTPTKACTYDFGFKTPADFVAVASVLEGVGVTAYLGAAALVTNSQYLTAAGSILTVEARHNAFIRNSKGMSPFPQAFDTPLNFNQVYSLAAPFIKSCPSDNPKLPVKAFPALTSTAKGLVKAGSTINFTVPKDFKAPDGGLFVAWPAVTGPVFQSATIKDTTVTCKVPDTTVAGPAGQAYAILTSNGKTLADNSTLAGPAVVNIFVEKL